MLFKNGNPKTKQLCLSQRHAKSLDKSFLILGNWQLEKSFSLFFSIILHSL